MQYIVEKGDTLYGISRQFGVGIEDIMKENNLTSNTITVGQKLFIPISGTITYQVKKGDSLWKIANMYNVTVEEIKKLNNLESDILTIGENLKIPVSNNQNDYIIYTIKKGDTLYSIAREYNTTVEKLKDINNLTTDTLTIGSNLKIPYEENNDNTFDVDYLIYTVKKGDSLYSIARKYNMSVEDLIKLNNLKTNVLTIGQQLKVVMGMDAIPLGSSCYGEGYVEPTYITHTVKRGDNLYDISRKYGVSIESIKALNNLTSNNLSIGQVLKIKEVS